MLRGKTIVVVKLVFPNLKTIMKTGIVDVFMWRNIPDPISTSRDNWYLFEFFDWRVHLEDNGDFIYEELTRGEGGLG